MDREARILVVDDEPAQRESMAVWLEEDGYRVDTAGSGEEAIAASGREDYAVYFVDLKMPPGKDGLETMTEIRRIRPDATIVIITAYGTVETAVTALKQGAEDYIVKPCDPHEISLLVERVLRVKRLRKENILLRQKLTKQYSFHDIVSRNPKMHEIFDLIKDVAALRSTVLIHGESGTGKELFARAIHDASPRREKPFVPVPCAALADTLLETELFGHERGAFTGAVGQKKGKFELADGGTIFLDEIGDISPKLQSELLRVLQERAFFRVGGSREVEVDVRVIAASNMNLQAAVNEGRFREDLFYRLNVITIRLPPLRERLEDIPLLARRFIERIATETKREIGDISEGALRLLMGSDWPGNVRELENAIERAIVVSRGPVLEESEFAFLEREAEESVGWSPPTSMTLREMERRMVDAALKRSGGNVKAAAKALGIDRSTLYEKIRKYGIERS